ncbi:hypothetical protein C5167_014189 [Papaver somniferum]|uniref:Uncharacterized protein n=1 Tax=Papaver somniferum TaxID=3469 RepID=A0A4Y7J3D9_PAPSO|nr:hypothetical protein C5167_014189 [Papaver somniferum]
MNILPSLVTKYLLISSIQFPYICSEIYTFKSQMNDYSLTLLEDGGMQAKAGLYKHNDELAKQLDHMEQKLEELLDSVVSKCRCAHETQNKNRNFPGICCNSRQLDTGTLRRLYYYVRAAENVKRLSLAELVVVGISIKVCKGRIDILQRKVKYEDKDGTSSPWLCIMVDNSQDNIVAQIRCGFRMAAECALNS